MEVRVGDEWSLPQNATHPSGQRWVLTVTEVGEVTAQDAAANRGIRLSFIRKHGELLWAIPQVGDEWILGESRCRIVAVDSERVRFEWLMAGYKGRTFWRDRQWTRTAGAFSAHGVLGAACVELAPPPPVPPKRSLRTVDIGGTPGMVLFASDGARFVVDESGDRATEVVDG